MAEEYPTFYDQQLFHLMESQTSLPELKHLEVDLMNELLTKAKTLLIRSEQDLERAEKGHEDDVVTVLKNIRKKRRSVEMTHQELQESVQQRRKELWDEQREGTRQELGLSCHQEDQAMETELADRDFGAQVMQGLALDQEADPPQIGTVQQQGAVAGPETADPLLQELRQEIKTFQQVIDSIDEHLTDCTLASLLGTCEEEER